MNRTIASNRFELTLIPCKVTHGLKKFQLDFSQALRLFLHLRRVAIPSFKYLTRFSFYYVEHDP